MDRQAWQATVHGDSKSGTWLSNFHFRMRISTFFDSFLRLNTLSLSLKEWEQGSKKIAQDGRSSSVQFSCSVMSNSLWHHGLQHARLPWTSLSPGVCSNSHSMGVDKCIMTCIYNCGIIQCTVTALKRLCALPVHLSLPRPWSFYCLHCFTL